MVPRGFRFCVLPNVALFKDCCGCAAPFGEAVAIMVPGPDAHGDHGAGLPRVCDCIVGCERRCKGKGLKDSHVFHGAWKRSTSGPRRLDLICEGLKDSHGPRAQEGGPEREPPGTRGSAAGGRGARTRSQQRLPNANATSRLPESHF